MMYINRYFEGSCSKVSKSDCLDFCSGQEILWYLLELLVPSKTLRIKEEPLISVISDRRVICKYRQQARSFLRDKIDDIWVSIWVNISSRICRSLYR